ncbi:hypothetical protein [Alteromonas stellipolaris]|jgi:hypothetical protein|uniref:hypothetical protein n=1 Tax=Alteromonas stellipolaris TaxID=233316 RepID=UPI001DE6B506|nr:hypothetical protein [Alteromonas stellipolaris]MBZ2163267.1 hypothetical protein [Alteromonas stellipolaris]
MTSYQQLPVSLSALFLVMQNGVTVDNAYSSIPNTVNYYLEFMTSRGIDVKENDLKTQVGDYLASPNAFVSAINTKLMLMEASEKEELKVMVRHFESLGHIPEKYNVVLTSINRYLS